MAKFTEIQFASILEEIAAAINSQIPIDQSLSRLQTRQLGQVGRLAGEIADQVTRGQSAADALDDDSSPIGRVAAGAIRACEKSGRGDLLLRVASHLRYRHAMTRQFRLGWFYPLLLLLLAYGIFAAVLGPVILEHQGRGFIWPEWLVSAATWVSVYWVVPPAIIVIAAVAIAIALGRHRGLSKQMQRCLLFQSLADQVELDVPESEAISTACTIAGIPETVVGSNRTFNAPFFAEQLNSNNIPPVYVDGVRHKQSLLAQLRYLAAHYAEKARTRSARWTRILPRIAMAVVGGGATLFYAWWIVAPVYLQVAQW